MREENIQYSLKKIIVLAELIRYEHEQYLGISRFRSPQVNMFARRISNDAKAVMGELKPVAELAGTDYAYQYNGVMWRIFDKLCELDLDVLEGHAEYLETALEKINL